MFKSVVASIELQTAMNENSFHLCAPIMLIIDSDAFFVFILFRF